MNRFIVKPNKTVGQILARRDLKKALSKPMPPGKWKPVVDALDTAISIDDYRKEMTQNLIEDGVISCGLCHLGVYHSSGSCSLGRGSGGR